MTDHLPGLGSVSRETLDRLHLLQARLQKWNEAINLVSRSSLSDAWNRHIVDSAQLYALAAKSGRWTDLGSGGGFPGLVIACMAEGEGADLVVTLIEADQRKATFLRQTASELAPRTKVVAARIEVTPPSSADTLSARALADFPKLLGYAQRHLAPHGTALFPKGASWEREVEKARKDWQFNLTVFQSVTDPAGAILAVKDLSHA